MAEFGAVGARLVRLGPASGNILRMPAPHLHSASSRKSRSGSSGYLSDEQLSEIRATRQLKGATELAKLKFGFRPGH